MSEFENAALQLLLKSTVGFDGLRSNPPYPPYNVTKVNDGVNGDSYVVSVAVAGFGEEDLVVETKDDTLTIKGKIQGENNWIKDFYDPSANTGGFSYLHKGIAARQFKLGFHLDKYVSVDSASLKNGLLHVKLVRNVPEEALPKKIPIKC